MKTQQESKNGIKDVIVDNYFTGNVKVGCDTKPFRVITIEFVVPGNKESVGAHVNIINDEKNVDEKNDGEFQLRYVHEKESIPNESLVEVLNSLERGNINDSIASEAKDSSVEDEEEAPRAGLAVEEELHPYFNSDNAENEESGNFDKTGSDMQSEEGDMNESNSADSSDKGTDSFASRVQILHNVILREMIETVKNAIMNPTPKSESSDTEAPVTKNDFSENDTPNSPPSFEFHKSEEEQSNISNSEKNANEECSNDEKFGSNFSDLLESKPESPNKITNDISFEKKDLISGSLEFHQNHGLSNSRDIQCFQIGEHNSYGVLSNNEESSCGPTSETTLEFCNMVTEKVIDLVSQLRFRLNCETKQRMELQEENAKLKKIISELERKNQRMKEIKLTIFRGMFADTKSIMVDSEMISYFNFFLIVKRIVKAKNVHLFYLRDGFWMLLRNSKSWQRALDTNSATIIMKCEVDD